MTNIIMVKKIQNVFIIFIAFSPDAKAWAALNALFAIGLKAVEFKTDVVEQSFHQPIGVRNLFCFGQHRFLTGDIRPLNPFVSVLFGKKRDHLPGILGMKLDADDRQFVMDEGLVLSDSTVSQARAPGRQ